MNILYVITGLGLGGAERVVVDLSDQMVLCGHQVKIAYLTGEIKVRPQSQEIEVVYLGLESWGDFISACRKYRDLIRIYEPEVVHSHMVHANIFTRLNRFFCTVPRLINSAHSNIEGGRLRMLAYRLTHHLADITTNVSKSAVKEFEKRQAVPIGGMRTVYNGIDLSKFTTQFLEKRFFNKDKVNFISVGRLHEAKDYPTLIQAISLVKKKSGKQTRFYIVGEGKLRSTLEKQIQQLNLSNDIILLGERIDIPNLLNQADFFISSSKYEGFGLVVAEAMACHCFVISTDSSGPSEIMGNTGILVEPQDSNKLAEAILSALGLSEEQIHLNNQQARKRIEGMFSLEKSVQVWLDIYENK